MKDSHFSLALLVSFIAFLAFLGWQYWYTTRAHEQHRNALRYGWGLATPDCIPPDDAQEDYALFASNIDDETTHQLSTIFCAPMSTMVAVRDNGHKVLLLRLSKREHD